MKSIQNLLQFINENWTTIIIIVGLGISVYRKVVGYLALSEAEKVAIAKQQIKEIVTKMVTDAECDYAQWNKAGQIKRSQVIKEIFDRYPVLAHVVNQKEVIAYIDGAIDDALKTLRDVLEEQDDQE